MSTEKSNKGIKQVYHEINQNIQDMYGITRSVKLPNGAYGLTRFTRGHPITVPVPDVFYIEIDNPPETPPRHFLQGRGCAVISDLFLATLRKAGVDNFQIFPAILQNPKTKQEWTGYHAFNEVGILDAALLEECKYGVIIEGDSILALYDFSFVVLSAQKLKDEPKMFRLMQDRHLYFSDELLTIICQNTPPEKWGITSTKTEVK
jgi:hypothetical protein